jgi:hypothetical protein
MNRAVGVLKHIMILQPVWWIQLWSLVRTCCQVAFSFGHTINMEYPICRIMFLGHLTWWILKEFNLKFYFLRWRIKVYRIFLPRVEPWVWIFLFMQILPCRFVVSTGYYTLFCDCFSHLHSLFSGKSSFPSQQWSFPGPFDIFHFLLGSLSLLPLLHYW